MAVVAVVAAVGIGASFAASRLEGVGVVAPSVEEGACKRYGTCSLEAASVVIITEEGIGKCRCYPYESVGVANNFFKKTSWRATARIMFTVLHGDILEEISTGGPVMPHNTIRNAVKALALNGKVFVQSRADSFTVEEDLRTLGSQSYHFPRGSQDAYISFENLRNKAWAFTDDGKPLPSQVYFGNASFHAVSRTFRGTVNWAPTTLFGDEVWQYEMVFDSLFSCIEHGQIHHYTPGVTDKGAPEQILFYDAAPASLVCPTSSAALAKRENAIRYRRFERICE